jgi:hypothetical protein
MRSSKCSISRLISRWTVSAVFFNGHGFFSREGAQATDLLVDLDQLLRQVLKAAKLGNFLFGFAHGSGRGQGLSNGLAGDFLREPSLGSMSGVVGLSAMAVRLTTAPDDGGNGAGLKIAQLRELLQELVAAVEQFRQRVRHGFAPGNDIGMHTERATYAQKLATKKETCRILTYKSRTPHKPTTRSLVLLCYKLHFSW